MIIFLQEEDMSFFSTLKTALSLKEKLAATGVLVLICALVGAGFAWERYQLKPWRKLAVLIRLLRNVISQ